MDKALLPYVYDDGGRSKYFKGNRVGDCVVRSIAIASGLDYKEVYDGIKHATKETPRNGVRTTTKAFKEYMKSIGFTWHATSGIGVRMAVHMVEGELPYGRLVCAVAKHYVAVVNNEVRDTWDSRYNSFLEVRRVYGYWEYKK